MIVIVQPELGISSVAIKQFCTTIEQEAEEKQTLKKLNKPKEKEENQEENDNVEIEAIEEGILPGLGAISNITSNTEVNEEIVDKNNKLPSEIKKERLKESLANIDFEIIRTAKTLYAETQKDYTISNKETVKIKRSSILPNGNNSNLTA